VPKIVRARPPHDDGEERKIRKLAGARHAPADWTERARIIVLSWDGLGVPAIAGRLGCHPKKVRRWLHRFNAAGIDGLGDRPGAGRRRRITEAERSAGIQVGRSQARRILLAEKVRWRRTRSWAVSSDPEFVPKGPRSWSCAPPRRSAPR